MCTVTATPQDYYPDKASHDHDVPVVDPVSKTRIYASTISSCWRDIAPHTLTTSH